MANWIKFGESSKNTSFINLDNVTRMQYHERADGGEHILITIDGAPVIISSENEPSAFAKIMAYLGANTGYNAYAEEGAPEGEDEVSES
jgi:hypothetical protein